MAGAVISSEELFGKQPDILSSEELFGTKPKGANILELPRGLAETAAFLTTGAAGFVGGKAAGLGTLILTGGDTGAAKAVEEGTADYLTFKPTTETGKQFAGKLGKLVSAPAEIGKEMVHLPMESWGIKKESVPGYLLETGAEIGPYTTIKPGAKLIRDVATRKPLKAKADILTTEELLTPEVKTPDIINTEDLRGKKPEKPVTQPSGEGEIVEPGATLEAVSKQQSKAERNKMVNDYLETFTDINDRAVVMNHFYHKIGAMEKDLEITSPNKVVIENTIDNIFKGIPPEVLKTPELKGKGETIATPEPTVGQTPASIAKSIEAKAVEQGLVKDGFDTLAGFDPTTMKKQASQAADLLNTDLEKTRRMVRGEEPLPEGLRGVSLVKAMEEHIKATKDADLAYELANSPLASEVSLAAQELSLTRGRELDSFSAKVADIKKARTEKAGKNVGKKAAEVKNNLKAETQKTNLSRAELSWDRFLKSIEC